MSHLTKYSDALRDICLFLLLAFAPAANASANPGTSSTFTISKINTREYSTDVFASTPISTPMACSRQDIVRIQYNASNYQAIMATLLFAFASSKSMSVWANACDTDGVPLFIAAFVGG